MKKPKISNLTGGFHARAGTAEGGVCGREGRSAEDAQPMHAGWVGAGGDEMHTGAYRGCGGAKNLQDIRERGPLSRERSPKWRTERENGGEENLKQQ